MRSPEGVPLLWLGGLGLLSLGLLYGTARLLELVRILLINLRPREPRPRSERLPRPPLPPWKEAKLRGHQAPPAPVVTPSMPLEPIRHKVRPGDTLSKLAEHYLGDSTRYPEIADLNGLSNPNLIYPGQVLLIPAERGAPPDLAHLRTLPRLKQVLVGEVSVTGEVPLSAEVPPTRPEVPAEVLTEEFDPNWPVQKKVAFWKPHALEAQRKTGVPWQVTLGQFGHESKYGRAIPPGSCNVFGVTADNETDPNKFVLTTTREGSGTEIERKFRKYASYSDSFADHLRLLTEVSVYEEAFEYSDPYQFVAMIWTGKVTAGYATDPYYVEKVAAHIYRMETGKYAKEDWPLTDASDQNSNNGGEVVHVIPKPDLLAILQERVYGDPTIRARLIERHQYLYQYSTQHGITYPKEVWIGTERVYVGD